jgi:hypothetical protein
MPADWYGVKLLADDLFDTAHQTAIDFENEGGETYLCGNPPYRGSGKPTNKKLTWQTLGLNTPTGQDYGLRDRLVRALLISLTKCRMRVCLRDNQQCLPRPASQRGLACGI